MQESFNASPRRWGEPQSLEVGQTVRILPYGRPVDAEPMFGSIVEIVVLEGHMCFMVTRFNGEQAVYNAGELKGL